MPSNNMQPPENFLTILESCMTSSLLSLQFHFYSALLNERVDSDKEICGYPLSVVLKTKGSPTRGIVLSPRAVPRRCGGHVSARTPVPVEP